MTMCPDIVWGHVEDTSSFFQATMGGGRSLKSVERDYKQVKLPANVP